MVGYLGVPGMVDHHPLIRPANFLGGKPWEPATLGGPQDLELWHTPSIMAFTWLARWWQLKYVLFSPRKLGKWSNLTHSFQMGWFNHQLAYKRAVITYTYDTFEPNWLRKSGWILTTYKKNWDDLPTGFLSARSNQEHKNLVGGFLGPCENSRRKPVVSKNRPFEQWKKGPPCCCLGYIGPGWNTR